MYFKKSILTLFLLIGVFASTEYALAQTVLYESYETGGSIPVWANGLTDVVPIGTFEVPEAMYFDHNGGVYAGFSFKNSSAFCHVTPHASILISSTTSATPSPVSLWSSDPFVNTSTDFEYHEVTNEDATAGSWLVPGHTYGIYFYPNCGAGTGSPGMEVTSDPYDLIYYGFLSFDGNYGSTFSSNAGITRIISVSPANASTTATSTDFTLASSIYINELDWEDDMFLRMRYVRNEDLQATGNPDLYYTNLDFPIATFGASNYSTTTDISRKGEYTLYTQIRTPSLSSRILSLWGIDGFFDPVIVVSTTTSFIAGERTDLDQFLFDIASTTNAILGNPGDLAENLDACNPITGWDTRKCITGIFLPTDAQLAGFFNEMKTAILSKAPLGYVTRFITILSSTSTSTIPTLSVEIASTTPYLSGVYSIDVAGGLASASDMINNDFSSGQGLVEVDQDQNLWDIVMPFLTTLGYLFLLLKMISDITGLPLLSRGTGQIGRHTGGVSKDEYAYKEKLYKMGGGTYQGRDKRNKEWYEQ